MAKKRKLLGMFTPASGQMRKADGNIINIANLVEKIQDTGLVIATKADEALGQFGSIDRVGAGVVTAPTGWVIYAISILAEAVVSAQIDANGIVNADLSAYSALPLGQPIYGRWTQIIITSGNIIAYIKPV